MITEMSNGAASALLFVLLALFVFSIMAIVVGVTANKSRLAFIGLIVLVLLVVRPMVITSVAPDMQPWWKKTPDGYRQVKSYSLWWCGALDNALNDGTMFRKSSKDKGKVLVLLGTNHFNVVVGVKTPEDEMLMNMSAGFDKKFRDPNEVLEKFVLQSFGNYGTNVAEMTMYLEPRGITLYGIEPETRNIVGIGGL